MHIPAMNKTQRSVSWAASPHPRPLSRERERGVRVGWLLGLTAWLALLPATLPAQSFEAERQGFVWKQGKEFVRFDKGRWSAGIEGGASVGWQMFLWHDKWIYETLPGGKIASGPTLQPDGSLTMSGVFSARENSARSVASITALATTAWRPLLLATAAPA